MTAPCPHCGTPVGVGHYISGDRVWHTVCNGWFRVWFRPSGARLVACDAPAT